MQVIKRYWYILVLIIVLIVSVCFYIKSNKTVEQEENYVDNKTVVSYAVDYFENFVSVVNVNEYDVTVAMLKNAKNNQLADYDMNELNKCEEESYVKFILNADENGYESYESVLICQK